MTHHAETCNDPNAPLAWKDYLPGSWLVVVYGQIHAKVNILGSNTDGIPNHFGINCEPYQFLEMMPGSGFMGTDPTLDQAKTMAEQMLSNVVIPAAKRLEAYNLSRQNEILT